uniref:Uncharacterized protein n=1 Tax=Anguilla anguilla TaxID=7936 RepID=A0A0E9R239_ANGAN
MQFAHDIFEKMQCSYSGSFHKTVPLG